MDPFSLAAAGVSGLANIASGILGSNANKKAAKLAAADAAANRDLQVAFAQNGIKWKVKDAQEAGIHPLAALGAQTISYTPQSIGYAPDTSMASAVSNMGQDVSRAVEATRSSAEKNSAYAKTVQDLTVQRMGLENQLLSSQIAKTNQASMPPMPSATDAYLVDGQAQSGLTPSSRVSAAHGLVQDAPLKRTASNPQFGNREPGAINDVGYARTNSGFAVVPSNDVKQRIEDNFLSEMAWEFRNRILPSFSSNFSPPFAAPAGKEWFFNGSEYRLRDKRANRGRFEFD